MDALDEMLTEMAQVDWQTLPAECVDAWAGQLCFLISRFTCGEQMEQWITYFTELYACECPDGRHSLRDFFVARTMIEAKRWDAERARVYLC